MNRYRIETGTVYEYEEDENGRGAYHCIGRTTQYTKAQLRQMSREQINED